VRALLFIFVLFSFVPAVFAAEEYICPMHPHIVGTEGDNCPICGMALVPKISKPAPTPEAEASREEAEMGAFQIDPVYIQALGVKTAEVAPHEFGKEIRAFGKIVPNTRLEYAVDVRTDGWIIDLPTSAIGDRIKQGDLLFTYYSPDLMAAQTDFLVGARLGSGVGGPEQRLRLYGMDDRAISELKKNGKFLDHTPFYAPIDGTVITLEVRKGSHVSAGGNILKLQDFSKVWVNIDVPVRDVGFLKIGTQAALTIPETGEKFGSAVEFIHPVNNPETRTVTVRLALDNLDGRLKPETYVDAVFQSEVSKRLAVPEEAILYGASGSYVLENMGGGKFRPVMVKTGITTNGLTEIKSGLKTGQSIVRSGQFMLDAESNLRGGMAQMNHDAEMSHE
jgi:Cu(I)/Ag(I) efflux system membrane fusion protein